MGKERLTEVIIGEEVESIYDYAFSGCTSLTSVTALCETPVSIDSNTFSNSADATLYVPVGCKSTYEAADYWKDFKEIIEIGFPDPETSESETTVTMSANGISTFSSSRDLDFSGVSGLKAYIVSGFSPSEGTLVLTPVTEVPAGTGLLLTILISVFERRLRRKRESGESTYEKKH